VSEDELLQILSNAYKYPAGEALAGINAEVLNLIKAERPNTIILPNDNLQISYAADRIFKQLGAGRELFMRGNLIVELRRDGTLEPVTQAEFCSRIEGNGRRRIVHVIKVNRGQEKPTSYVLVPQQCSQNTAALLMSAPAAAELPPLAVIADCALLVENAEGALEQLGHGYHEFAGGVLVRTRETPPDVPPNEAVTAILELFSEFQFTTPADKSRAVAQMIGPALRFGGLVAGHALMNAVEAKASQTGKGYLLKLCRTPYSAAAYDVVQKVGGVGSIDETMAQAILAGYSFIAFENMKGRLDSAQLEHALTAREKFSVRVPYKAPVRVDISRVIFQLTSNGVEGTSDLANRLLLVRLEKRQGAFKEFKEGDLVAHVEARASYYLGCIFAVVREWHGAGKPLLFTTHSFREWVGALDWVVQRVFELPPLLDGHATAVQRIANPGLSWLRLITAEIVRRNWYDGREFSATELLTISNDLNLRVTESDEEQKQLMAVGRRLGEAFAAADNETITVEGIQVSRRQFLDPGGRAAKRYAFGERGEV
jgi:hypothetical protein